MAIPAQLMQLLQGAGGGPGVGGTPPPPMGGPGLPGGPPDPVLASLAQAQQSPPPEGEKEAIRDATMKMSMALGRVQTRSAKSAKLLAEAISKAQQAIEALSEESQRPLNAPPDLGLSGGALSGQAATGPF